MRTITIPAEWLAKAADPSTPGRVVEGVVAVDWPELRLTEAQMIANALASANGQTWTHALRGYQTVARAMVEA